MPVSSLSTDYLVGDFLKAAPRPRSVRKLPSERAKVVRNVAFRITVASPKSPVAGSPVRLKATAPQPRGHCRDARHSFASPKSIASGKTVGGEGCS
jgi:hypothetical protein